MAPPFKTSVFVTLLAASVHAATAAVLKRQSAITALTAAQIASFRPYTHYASTGYCVPSSTKAWDCGANCQANPTFQPIASGGDGDETQFCTSSIPTGASVFD